MFQRFVNLLFTIVLCAKCYGEVNEKTDILENFIKIHKLVYENNLNFTEIPYYAMLIYGKDTFSCEELYNSFEDYAKKVEVQEKQNSLIEIIKHYYVVGLIYDYWINVANEVNNRISINDSDKSKIRTNSSLSPNSNTRIKTDLLYQIQDITHAELSVNKNTINTDRILKIEELKKKVTNYKNEYFKRFEIYKTDIIKYNSDHFNLNFNEITAKFKQYFRLLNDLSIYNIKSEVKNFKYYAWIHYFNMLVTNSSKNFIKKGIEFGLALKYIEAMKNLLIHATSEINEKYNKDVIKKTNEADIEIDFENPTKILYFFDLFEHLKNKYIDFPIERNEFYKTFIFIATLRYKNISYNKIPEIC